MIEVREEEKVLVPALSWKMKRPKQLIAVLVAGSVLAIILMTLYFAGARGYRDDRERSGLVNQNRNLRWAMAEAKATTFDMHFETRVLPMLESQIASFEADTGIRVVHRKDFPLISEEQWGESIRVVRKVRVEFSSPLTEDDQARLFNQSHLFRDPVSFRRALRDGYHIDYDHAELTVGYRFTYHVKPRAHR